MNSDWRLTNQMDYLYQTPLIYSRYVKLGTNDHDHCEFCWEKFGEGEDMIHFGFCTADRYRWICETCFQDFKELFQWRVINIKQNPEDVSLSSPG